MMAATMTTGRVWDRLWRKVNAAMDVILHLGAHRTGSTAFQGYMEANAHWFAAMNTAFWGPQHTRKGLFDGLLVQPMTPRAATRTRRNTGRVRMQMAQLQIDGARRLLISDENVLGSARTNLRDGALYHDAGDRVARINAAFDGKINRIALNVRALDDYWASAIAYVIPRGARVPGRGKLAAVSTHRRGWRDVITEIACAAPDAQITVTRFEDMKGRPDSLFKLWTGATAAPKPGDALRRNERPDLAALRAVAAARGNVDAFPEGDGHWQPFDAAQAASLKELYHDDLFWLRSGADGLAHYHEEVGTTPAATHRPGGPQTRGHKDDREKGRMVETR